jgi:integrase
MERADLPSATHLVLADGVVHLDPEHAVFDAMVAGWERQQRTRFLKDATIRPRIALVRRFGEFTNSYPWQWEPADGEDFITHLRAERDGARPITVSTARGYEVTITLFMQYVTDPRYRWPAVCRERFGSVPQQVFHEGNSVAHVTDFEGQPGRRPLTYDEVQALFDAADGRVEHARLHGHKGALPALRDAALLKTVYAYGFRRREVQRPDLRRCRSTANTARGSCGGASPPTVARPSDGRC